MVSKNKQLLSRYRNCDSASSRGGGIIPVVCDVIPIHNSASECSRIGFSKSLVESSNSASGILLAASRIGPQVVVASVNFLAKADATTCAQVISECVNKYAISYKNIRGLVTDSACYMTKCVNSLQVLYGDHVLHIQCWAHKVALVGNVLSCELVEVNDVVVKVKSAFLNTRKRKHQYLQYLREETVKPDKLFPMPVNTRWNSWFRAVFYLAEYFLEIINFFRNSDFQETNNAGIKYLIMLSDKEVSVILAQCIFVQQHAFEIMDLLTKLEGSKYPTSHTLYGDLENIQKGLDCAAKGIFSNTFENSSVLKNLNTTDIAHVKHNCQKATTLCMNKLQTLMNSDPCAHVYRSLNQLFNPKNILLNKTENIVTQLKSIADLKMIDSVDLFKGYQSLKDAAESLCRAGEVVDVVKILTALTTDCQQFASAVLKSIWMPTNNVESERLLSHYNIVVSDRRQNLKEENIEVFTMLSFDD
ncbi:uncharacterized protein LOC134529127 isoform X3 [Bacillus rossius redtenbacheri]|uniref:uncharacterized protein LOC134529127 isoform X3 n=1 Tax=Bacillus rossius redtenbacheri TaxID=93214 RepID=UPI002FDC822E